MKTIIKFLLFTFSMHCFSQENYIVIAENGLTLREQPSTTGQKIGKLYFGAEVIILEKTKHSEFIIDGNKKIKGTWVKVKFNNSPIFISNKNFGYVFDGYLKDKMDINNDIIIEISKFPKLNNYEINKITTPYYLRGDFYGDKTDDLVVLLKNKKGVTKIGIINYGDSTNTYILGDKNCALGVRDFSWIGIFNKVNPGVSLWSNYEDDFIDFEDVPENKKVKLPYNALYVHAAESCGGGFIFWKDGKFNWLQQE